MKEHKIFVYVGTWPVPVHGSVPVKPVSAAAKSGIYGFCMNAETGDWVSNGDFYTSSLTSMFCTTANGKFLYSTDETRNRGGIPCSGGGILTFFIDGTSGRLQPINEKSSMGALPAYMEIDASGKYLFVANMGNRRDKFVKVIKSSDGNFIMTTAEEEGSLAMFRLLDNGAVSDVIDMADFGCTYPDCDGDRQHLHCVKVDPSNNYLLVSDTNDKIHVFRIDHKLGKLIPAEDPCFITHSGVVPRLMHFHPDKPWFFVNNERNSTVYSFAFDSSKGKISQLDYASSVFNEEDSEKTWTSCITVHGNGKFLYVSSRSQIEKMPDSKCPPNSIAIFEIDQITGKLNLKAVTPIVGDNPRGMAFDPGYKFLYITSVHPGVIIRYAVDNGTGLLSNPAVVANVPLAASIKFVTVP